MVLLALITEPRVVARILRHLGFPTTPPPLAPARDPYDELEAIDPPNATVRTFDDPPRGDSARRPGQGRAPPKARP